MMASAKKNQILLTPSEDRLEKLKNEKKRLLIEEDEDLTLQGILYRFIDGLPDPKVKRKE